MGSDEFVERHSPQAKEIKEIPLEQLKAIKPTLARIFAEDRKPGLPRPTGSMGNTQRVCPASQQRPLAALELLMRRVIAIQEKSLGPDHPEVARDLTKAAKLLRALNRPDEAELLLRRALWIVLKCTRTTGQLHEYVGAALENYVRFLKEVSPDDNEVPQRLKQVFESAGVDPDSLPALADSLSKSERTR